MYFFTSDEHYYHSNIIKYCNRPFRDVHEMNEKLIENHNALVGSDDCTVHAGDFSFGNLEKTKGIISRLNGKHIFLQGNHDRWSESRLEQIWEKKIDKKFVVVCHYAMRVWNKSHRGSWHLFGHSHGTLPGIENSFDVGVDNNRYIPVSFDKIKMIMQGKDK